MMRAVQTTRPLLIGALTLIVIGLAPSLASAQPSKQRQIVVRQVPVHNPGSLAHFHESLDSLQEGSRRYVRVAHFGDSNVAADLWTGAVRSYLQTRYGDAGPGYLLPRPHGSWHQGPTVVEAGDGFQTRRHGFAKLFGPRDGLWGLAGVAMEGTGPRAWFKVQTDAVPPSGGIFSLHLLGRPGGGRVAVVIDRDRPDGVDATLPRTGLVRQMWPLRPGAHVIRGQAVNQQPVRVLGMVVEYRQPGVIYDTLGINGHRASAINLWNETLLAQQFRARPPDLVVLSYGGNEGLSRSLSIADYERDLREAIQRMRRLAPQASCLLVGPVAMCPERSKVTQVTAVQRRVAPEYSCGFWDSRQVSGGPGSLCHWITSGQHLVAGDRLHLRKNGYDLVAREFTRAILP